MNLSRRLFPLFGLILLAVSAARAGEQPHPDVRVLIDVSGSMKQNDPHNLRKPALDLLLNLFPGDAKAGVWTFGQSVEVLAPHQKVSDAWRAQARRKIGQITSNALYTNIPDALERAAYDAEQRDPDYRVSVILLTDGMVDIAKSPEENAAARQRVLTGILPRLRQAGVIVHTVALSNAADRELMQRLAADTNGLSAVAETADDLRRVFLQAFDAAAPAEQVPLAGNHFLADASIDELTALVFHGGDKPLVLEAPDQKRHSFASHGDNVRWFQGQGFDLVTVKKPAAGEWTVVADLEKGSRVTILSNLSLAAERLPDGLFTGGATPRISVALTQQGEAMTDPALLKLVALKVGVQRREDGRQWQIDPGAGGSIPTDGRYHVDLAMLAEPGNYDIAVDADGKTFQRSQRQAVAVRAPFEVRVDAAGERSGHTVTLFARNPAVDSAASVVTAHIQGPDGASRDQAVASTAEREWSLPLDAGEQGGHFEVVFDVAGQYLSGEKLPGEKQQGENRPGEKFTFRSPRVAVDQNGGRIVAPAAKVEPEPVTVKRPEAPVAAQSPAPAEAPAAANPSRQWLLYGGLALGNLLILGLGFAAFRFILGGSRSEVLEAPDDEEEAPPTEETSASAKPGRSGRPANMAAQDLPDDAIDIDPAVDK